MSSSCPCLTIPPLASFTLCFSRWTGFTRDQIHLPVFFFLLSWPVDDADQIFNYHSSFFLRHLQSCPLHTSPFVPRLLGTVVVGDSRWRTQITKCGNQITGARGAWPTIAATALCPWWTRCLKWVTNNGIKWISFIQVTCECKEDLRIYAPLLSWGLLTQTRYFHCLDKRKQIYTFSLSKC